MAEEYIMGRGYRPIDADKYRNKLKVRKYTAMGIINSGEVKKLISSGNITRKQLDDIARIENIPESKVIYDYNLGELGGERRVRKPDLPTGKGLSFLSNFRNYYNKLMLWGATGEWLPSDILGYHYEFGGWNRPLRAKFINDFYQKNTPVLDFEPIEYDENTKTYKVKTPKVNWSVGGGSGVAGFEKTDDDSIIIGPGTTMTGEQYVQFLKDMKAAGKLGGGNSFFIPKEITPPDLNEPDPDLFRKPKPKPKPKPLPIDEAVRILEAIPGPFSSSLPTRLDYRGQIGPRLPMLSSRKY